MDSFSLGVETTFSKSCEELVLYLIPSNMCLVEGMKDSQTVYLVVFQLDHLILNRSSMHIEGKLSKLLQHQILISSLL